jgi:hypothetical protein
MADVLHVLLAQPSPPCLSPCWTSDAGVYDAIKKGHLKALLFGVASDYEGSDLLEVRA